ncbi:hypothetical protein B9Z55_001655 [Caenorhabditis nigoni]|uniref:Uncharacterized protein n=1 Tax=Caenorhabditis nigoni TaxID=1611254 RepID=A0A2G5VGS9_9PELO|nr:hypothetical protein B9Z55_001655 [Caenorhabditis nigoni]
MGKSMSNGGGAKNEKRRNQCTFDDVLLLLNSEVVVGEEDKKGNEFEKFCNGILVSVGILEKSVSLEGFEVSTFVQKFDEF